MAEIDGDPFEDSLDITDTSDEEDNSCKKLDGELSGSGVSGGKLVDAASSANPKFC